MTDDQGTRDEYALAAALTPAGHPDADASAALRWLALRLTGYEVIRSGPHVRVRCTAKACRNTAPPGQHLVAHAARLPLPALVLAILEHETNEHAESLTPRARATGQPAPGVNPLNVDCPKCSAARGLRCHTAALEHTRVVPHTARFDAAGAAAAADARTEANRAAFPRAEDE